MSYDDEVKSTFGGLSLDFEEHEPEEEVRTKLDVAPRNDKQTINEIASETNFRSTQVSKPEPKVIPMSISLFPDEHIIMTKAVSSFEATPEHVGKKASRSDIIRAALYYFDTLPTDEQVRRVAAHRGRPKK